MPAKHAPRTPFLLALLAKALMDRAVQGYCRGAPALRRAIGTTTLTERMPDVRQQSLPCLHKCQLILYGVRWRCFFLSL